METSYGQIAVNTTKDVAKKNFRLVLTLFGVTQNNSDIFVYSDARDTVRGKMINASEVDRLDNVTDGIAEISFVYPNTTILNAGEQYSACAVMLKHPKMICDTNLKSARERTEFIDLYVGEKPQ